MALLWYEKLYLMHANPENGKSTLFSTSLLHAIISDERHFQLRGHCTPNQKNSLFYALSQNYQHLFEK